MGKTKKDYEIYLNELYAEMYRDYHSANEALGYLTAKLKNQRRKWGGIHQVLINHYNSRTLGSLLRKNDPIGFEVGYREWK